MHAGDPVVAVVAETCRIADDAADLVQVEYEALDAVGGGRQGFSEITGAIRSAVRYC